MDNHLLDIAKKSAATGSVCWHGPYLRPSMDARVARVPSFQKVPIIVLKSSMEVMRHSWRTPIDLNQPSVVFFSKDAKRISSRQLK